MSPAADVAREVRDELARQGVVLVRSGDQLRFTPRNAVSPDLLARMKQCKAELLLLAADGRLADLPPSLCAAVNNVRRVFGDMKLVRIDRRESTARDADAPPVAAWVSLQRTQELRPAVVELVSEQQGWAPAAWRTLLLRLAHQCERANPARAVELRQAAILMTPGLDEAFEERAAIMEFDAGLARTEAEAAAAADVLHVARLNNCSTEKWGLA